MGRLPNLEVNNILYSNCKTHKFKLKYAKKHEIIKIAQPQNIP